MSQSGGGRATGQSREPRKRRVAASSSYNTRRNVLLGLRRTSTEEMSVRDEEQQRNGRAALLHCSKWSVPPATAIARHGNGPGDKQSARAGLKLEPPLQHTHHGYAFPASAERFLVNAAFLDPSALGRYFSAVSHCTQNKNIPGKSVTDKNSSAPQHRAASPREAGGDSAAGTLHGDTLARGAAAPSHSSTTRDGVSQTGAGGWVRCFV